MIKWGQNSKPQKILDQNLTPKKSHAEFPSIKTFQKALNDVTITDLQIVLITPKNTCQNFPTQKNPEIEKYPSIISVT